MSIYASSGQKHGEQSANQPCSRPVAAGQKRRKVSDSTMASGNILHPKEGVVVPTEQAGDKFITVSFEPGPAGSMC